MAITEGFDGSQRIRLKIWILVAFSVLVCSGLVVGQEENSGDFVRISIEVEEGLESYAAPIMSRVEENLALHGIDLEIVDSEANVDIAFYATRKSPKEGIVNETIWFSMQGNTPTELSMSPVLYSQAGILYLPLSSMAPEWGGKTKEEAISDWISGLALYSLDRCDIAYPYFQEEISRSVEIDAFLVLYAGNCALITGDIEGAASHFSDGWFLVLGRIAANPSMINLGWTLLQREEGEVWDLPDEQDWPLPYLDCGSLYEGSCKPDTRFDQLVRIAQLYALAFDYDAAISRMDTAIAIVEDNMRTAIRVDAEIVGDFTRTDVAELYTLRGQMWLLLYEWDQVLEDYNTAIDLDPAYPDAYFYRGVLYYSVLQAGLTWREDALADFDHYLELAPEGALAGQAQDYADTIRRELDALNN